MLQGALGDDNWSREDLALARQHRIVLAEITSAGHAWVLSEEFEGIWSATGLDEGVLRSVEAIVEVATEVETDRDT